MKIFHLIYYYFSVFNKSTTLNKGLNLLVVENGCGKSTIIDLIRLLLNEDEHSRNGVKDEDFYSAKDNINNSDKIFIKYFI